MLTEPETMYLFCSECGWTPDQFLDLTRRQFRHLIKAKVSLSERIRSQVDSEDGTPKSASGRKNALNEAIQSKSRFEPNSMEELLQVHSMFGAGATGVDVKRRGK